MCADSTHAGTNMIFGITNVTFYDNSGVDLGFDPTNATWAKIDVNWNAGDENTIHYGSANDHEGYLTFVLPGLSGTSGTSGTAGRLKIDIFDIDDPQTTARRVTATSNQWIWNAETWARKIKIVAIGGGGGGGGGALYACGTQRCTGTNGNAGNPGNNRDPIPPSGNRAGAGNGGMHLYGGGGGAGGDVAITEILRVKRNDGSGYTPDSNYNHYTTYDTMSVTVGFGGGGGIGGAPGTNYCANRYIGGNSGTSGQPSFVLSTTIKPNVQNWVEPGFSLIAWGGECGNKAVGNFWDDGQSDPAIAQWNKQTGFYTYSNFETLHANGNERTWGGRVKSPNYEANNFIDGNQSVYIHGGPGEPGYATYFGSQGGRDYQGLHHLPFMGTKNKSPYNKSWGVPGKIAPTGGGGGGGILKDGWFTNAYLNHQTPSGISYARLHRMGGDGGAIKSQNPNSSTFTPTFDFASNPSPGATSVDLTNTAHRRDTIFKPRSLPAYNTFVGLGGYGGGWDISDSDYSTSGSPGGYGRSVSFPHNDEGTHWLPGNGNKFGGGGGGGRSTLNGTHYKDPIRGPQKGGNGANGVVIIIQEG